MRQVGCYLMDLFGSLRGRWLQYERNEPSAPLVDRLSDKAMPGSYALDYKG